MTLYSAVTSLPLRQAIQKEFDMNKNLEEFVKESIPVLLDRKATKIEQDLDEGSVTAYWAGTILRIDYKPTSK